MGHYLRTSNPEAADAIGHENAPPDRELPPIGSMVHYHARPGDAPGGKYVAGMQVTAHLPDGRISGVATYDANDRRDVQGVWQRSENNMFPSWDWIEDEAPKTQAPPDTGEMRLLFEDMQRGVNQQITHIRDQLGVMKDWNEQFARDIDEQEEELRELVRRVDTMRIDVNTLKSELGLDKPPEPKKGRK